MHARVICCNDSIEEVFLGEEADAVKRLEEVKTEDIRKWTKNNGIGEKYPYDRMYWHIHTVRVSVKEFK